MHERTAPQTSPDGEQDVTTPDVNIQDVEHDARPETRVNNAGVKVEPPLKKQGDPLAKDTRPPS
jgi:hypothetical protein